MSKEQHPAWVITLIGLTMLVLALLGSRQAYYDCIDDGRPRYECGHYARRGR